MIGESVVMLELQRHGSEGRRCEFPGGRVEAGQSELEAAEQELAEEIGVRPDVLCYEGRLSPLPGVVSETVALYSAF